MRLLTGYAISVGWIAAFLALAFVARALFDWISPFKLRAASDRKDAAVGHVLRGLYFALAIISLAAIQSTQSIIWALLDSLVGVVLSVRGDSQYTRREALVRPDDAGGHVSVRVLLRDLRPA